MADTNFDLIVVGGGPGGYVAAIRAAQLGMKAALVEREHLGGICLNWGCIPTKALLRSAEVCELMRHAEDFGLAADNSRFDVAGGGQALARGGRSSSSAASAHLLKKNKVTVFDGAGAGSPARASSRSSSRTASERRRSRPSTSSSRPARARAQLPGPGGRRQAGLDLQGGDGPASMPKSLLVVGSGAIGIEFASFYRTLGAEVTVVEVLPTHPAGRGRGDLGLRPQGVREARHEDPRPARR